MLVEKGDLRSDWQRSSPVNTDKIEGDPRYNLKRGRGIEEGRPTFQAPLREVHNPNAGAGRQVNMRIHAPWTPGDLTNLKSMFKPVTGDQNF
ncbi:hypothetical protein FKM82_017977 [Ascaphus truei]